uniref:Uncharacterized protein n=1 Tax=Anopheles coluzzii TaxID=1518534 RepID=A0A8W7PQX3_ANOCL
MKMKFFWLITIAVVALAQMVLGYQNYGQSLEPAEEQFCLSEQCDTPKKCPSGSSWNGKECSPDCQCGMDH